MPHSPPKPAISYAASSQYFEQHRAVVEHQRQLHHEERELWHLERRELQTKVAELEAIVARLRSRNGSGVSSPHDPFASGFLGASSGNVGSRHINGTNVSTGDEFWRGAGGKSGVTPTRTFSESSEFSNKDERRMPVIAEDEEQFQKPTGFGVSKDETRHQPTIDGAKIDKNLDGISFKSSGLPPEIIAKVLTPQSPSPRRDKSPVRILCSQSLLPRPTEQPEDPYTKDAGHTPIARSDPFDGAEALSPTTSSTHLTPKLPAERPPLEPYPSVAVSQPSHDRSDDAEGPAPADTLDEDPVLRDPIGLTNREDEDCAFLDVLDSKLLTVARSIVREEEGEGVREGGRNGMEGTQPEPEPRLKMKRSMNFGTVFGAKTCGRGI